MAILSMLFFAATVFLQPDCTSANGGPVISSPEGLGVRFDEHSPIRLEEETVHFRFSPSSKNGLKRQTVQVTYRLKNMSNRPVSTHVLFFIPEYASDQKRMHAILEYYGFQVFLNGQEVPLQFKGPIHLDNWTSKPVKIPDPFNGQRIGVDNLTKPTGIQFPLSMAKNETIQLEIRYRDKGGIYEKGRINPIFSHLYYLTPAKFWSGKPTIHLSVELPSDSYRLASNIPLHQKNERHYGVTLHDLPKEEWIFSDADTQGIWFGTNNNTMHNAIVITMALASGLALLTIGLRMNRGWIIAVSYAVSLGIMVLSIHRVGEYPLNVFLYPIVLGGVLAVQGFIHMKWRVNQDRKQHADSNR